MTKCIPLSEAKRDFSSIIKDVEEKYDRFIITKNGIDTGVILSTDEFNGMLETLDILSNKEEKEAIARAKEQIKKKQTVSLHAFKARHNLK